MTPLKIPAPRVILETKDMESTDVAASGVPKTANELESML